ncbi:peptide ABC transporter substrate-binding protein [Clostridium sp. DJ247]|uniref:peptide ABC transporter substrate-binding protein n=1 Tax=Clostridium sp. DJ247 TaxID=2726188 RepID=UPI00162A45A8|nr:peptide ABC transporter substrate-binding protein [Clostridium sp. DJ247]MBC2582766.1 peptide ABC transporter substrate-binding protein [Clostridium sp. DJ247]
MKRKSIISLLLATLVLGSALVGCSSNKSIDSTQKTAETKLDADQTANVLAFDHTSLDPSVVSDTETFTTMTNVYEGLMREKSVDGKVTNVLAGAKKMDKSSDGLTYTFTLRDDAKWSDGQPVKAQDYVFSWRRLCDPKVSQDYLGFLEEIGVKGAAEVAAGKADTSTLGVASKDDKTFVVTLAHPTPYFESALSFKGLLPQREDIVKKLGDQYGQDFKNMVYNGAFTVSDYQKGSKIVYKKNDNYWDAKNVKLTTVNGYINNESATVVKMFNAKQIDFLDYVVTGDDIKTLDKNKDAGGYQHTPSYDPSVYYFIYNTTNKYLSNAKVRLALSLSYDRQAQINTVWKKNYVAEGVVPSKIMVGDKDYRQTVNEPLKDVKADPKQLLKEGLAELGISDPSQVKLKLWMKPASAESTSQAQFIQNQWQNNLGIKIDIVYAPDNPSYFKSRTNHEFDICAGGWGADYNDVFSFFNLFTSNNGNNNGLYKNPEFDALVKKGMTDMDPAKRLDYFKQAEQILVAKDAAVSPNYYRSIDSFSYNYLKGVYVPLFGGYFDLKDAYISGKQ